MLLVDSASRNRKENSAVQNVMEGECKSLNVPASIVNAKLKEKTSKINLVIQKGVHSQ